MIGEMAVSQDLAAVSPGTPVHSSMAIAMDTVVSIEVLSVWPEATVSTIMQRAQSWFSLVEQACSRFDAESEVQRASARVGKPFLASPVLFEAIQFALALARSTNGAFDPTIGQVLEAKGFNRNYLTGERVHSANTGNGRVSYRDVRLDPARRTITLRRPLVLDLGAVAKGLAIDLAARELSAFDSFCIDAGGDIFARGRNRGGRPWRIGVRDPRGEALADVLEVSDQAVCTSGDYERRTVDGLEHHLVDPRTGRSARALASVTVVAPIALAADGLATAAFILGPERGLRLLEREGVGGLLITPSGEVRTTHGLQLTRALVRESQ
jgi:thiamine biosynthesis lipoprotein